MIIEGIAPIVPVRDLAVSLPFYAYTLGFALKTHVPQNNFALLSRQGAGIILPGGCALAPPVRFHPTLRR